jgi:predicted outer membrane protein
MPDIDNLRREEEKAKAELDAATQAVKDAEARKARAFAAWMKANRDHLEAKLREELRKS